MSKTGSEHHSNEGFSRSQRRPTHRKIMLGSRRHWAAAAGFWFLLLAAATGISVIPGAMAADRTPVFSDGFESGNLSQWTVSSGMTDQQQVTYAGSWAARATSTGSPAYAYKNLSTPLGELYYAGRFQAISQGAANVSIVRFRTPTNGLIFSIFRLGNGKLSYYNSLTGVTTSGPRVSTGSWHELQVHALINGTSSVVEVWLDGAKVITKTAESLGTTAVGRVYIGDNTTGHTFDYAFDNDVLTAVDSTAPSTPNGLTVTGSTESSISLRWNASTDNVGVAGYHVFRNNSALGTTTATNYTLTGLSCGTSYTLGIDAFDPAGNTSGQATVIASTGSCNGQLGQPPSDDQPPTTPSGLNVSGASASAIWLGWNASTDNVGVGGYDLFQNNARVGSTAGTSYTFAGLTCGTSYTLGVDAYDAAGNVSSRASITAATSACGGGGGGGYVKTDDSTNAEPVGLSLDSNNCSLARTELGDTLTILAASDRCTWTNQHFSHMHRHEVFEISERFDLRTANPGSWENNLVSRPYGNFGNADCSDGGNHELMLWTIRIKSVDGADHWFLELRGGTSLNLSDQYLDPAYPGAIADGTSVDLGPVVQGRTETFKFDVVSDYQHGAATVWHNGVMVYNNRDRPLGFHYDCDRTTDISNFDLRMQHGVYRGWSGPLVLTSSGFHFLVSEPEN
jgi:chitodextrinase